MTKWLYWELDAEIPPCGVKFKLIPVDDSSKSFCLEDIGQEGWVLAETFSVSDSRWLRFIFKRSVS